MENFMTLMRLIVLYHDLFSQVSGIHPASFSYLSFYTNSYMKSLNIQKTG